MTDNQIKNERDFLGACICIAKPGSKNLIKAIKTLDVDCFTHPHHRNIFSEIKQLITKGMIADVITISNAVEKHNIDLWVVADFFGC